MTVVVDRRDVRGRSTASRQRFLERNTRQIRKAIDRAIQDGNVTDIGKGGVDVPISRDDTEEPWIHHGEGGVVRRALPGNKKYQAGDRIERPSGEGAGKAGDGSGGKPGDGPGDGFKVHITEEEFLGILFSDLELPNLVERGVPSMVSPAVRNAGFVSRGSPSRLDLLGSKKKKLARIFAAESPHNDRLIGLLEEARHILQPGEPSESLSKKEWEPQRVKIRRLEQEFNALRRGAAELPEESSRRLEEIDAAVAETKQKIGRIPAWNESTDLRFRYRTTHPNPSTSAVIVCDMDVSGSMSDDKKYLAKLFYFLLYRFLKKHYQNVEVVFIRHHTEAAVVSEDEFFNKGESGGTFVSSGLVKALEVIRERFPSSAWNVYVAQASDGDNFDSDNPAMKSALRELLPLVQGFFYTEIKPEGSRYYESSLMPHYEPIAKEFSDRMWTGTIRAKGEVFPLFREFFKKRGKVAAEGPVAAASKFSL